MASLRKGARAPAFALRDALGKVHRLSGYRGRKVVLYFYPRDDTPGCAAEARDFNRELAKIQKKNAVVIGVSPDNEVSHKKFAEKLNLGFTLLADPDGLISSKYGAYGEKTLFGRKFNGIFRTTYIIDEKGVIEKVFGNVKVDGHAKAVLKAL